MGADGSFDSETLNKRLGTTQDYDTSALGGKNYKSIHDTLKLKECMKIGSAVIVTSGTHEGLEGRIVSIVESNKKT